MILFSDCQERSEMRNEARMKEENFCCTKSIVMGEYQV